MSERVIVGQDENGVSPWDNLFLNIIANATTTVKSGYGKLARITVNTAGTSSTATIYDNTAGSGTKIGTINTTVAGTYYFQVGFSTGLTIVTAGTGAADLTVIYR